MWPHQKLSEFCTETWQMELVFHVWMAVRTRLVSNFWPVGGQRLLVWWRVRSEANEAGRPPRTCFPSWRCHWCSDWCCRSLPAWWSCPPTPSSPQSPGPPPGPSAVSQPCRFFAESPISVKSHRSWRWPGRRRNSGFSSCCRWSPGSRRVWTVHSSGLLSRNYPQLQHTQSSVSLSASLWF